MFNKLVASEGRKKTGFWSPTNMVISGILHLVLVGGWVRFHDAIQRYHPRCDYCPHRGPSESMSQPTFFRLSIPVTHSSAWPNFREPR